MTHKWGMRQLFYGTTTVGEKGQIVIPAEARASMKLKKGEKLLVFGNGGEMLAITKSTSLAQMAAHLTTKLAEIRKILRKNLNSK
jgi:AbrB family looped-hinge helix DNA binding protein